jgi:hypothetical protein
LKSNRKRKRRKFEWKFNVGHGVRAEKNDEIDVRSRKSLRKAGLTIIIVRNDDSECK